MNFAEKMLAAFVKATIEHNHPGGGAVVDQAIAAGEKAGLTPADILQQLLALLWANAGPAIVAAIQAWIASLLPKPPAPAA